MMTDLFVFGAAVLLVEMAIAYSVLYIISYKIFRLQRKIEGVFLAWILVIIAFIISLACFTYCAGYVLEKFF